MQSTKTYKAVGIFVIVGLLSLAGVIINYVGQKFTTNEKDLVVMYFEESVQGLSVGSPVVLHGVEVGKVAEIKLLANLKEATFQTPVFVLFDKKTIASYKKNRTLVTDDSLLMHLVKKGLKAKLASANYLTGQLMIELMMDPAQPAVFRGNGSHKEIPTELSAFAKISKDLNAIPLHESLTRLGDVLVKMDESLPEILENVAQITDKLDKMLSAKSGELSKTLMNANTAMEEFSKANRSIKNLADYLERHPEALIRGKEK